MTLAFSDGGIIELRAPPHAGRRSPHLGAAGFFCRRKISGTQSTSSAPGSVTLAFRDGRIIELRAPPHAGRRWDHLGAAGVSRVEDETPERSQPLRAGS